MTVVQDIGYGREFEGFYDRLFPNNEYADQTAEKLAALHPGGGLPTLELGVGTGRIAIPLARRVGRIVGVDSSPEMLSQLHEKVGQTAGEGAGITGVHGDIRDYTDDEQYGLVYCVCSTLAMILDPDEQRQTIEHAAARLAPGGTLVVETSNRDGIIAMHEGKQRTSYLVPYPEPNTALLTYSTLIPERNLWQASHIWFEPGSHQTGTEVARLTSPDEVDDYAAGAGLKPVGERRADWMDTPYSRESSMFITTYQRGE